MKFLCRFARLPILVLLLVSTIIHADTAIDNADSDLSPVILASDAVNSGIASSSTGAVSYWLLAFLLAFNVAGVIHMRRWAATIERSDDKE